jgi:hypothetical protein
LPKLAPSRFEKTVEAKPAKPKGNKRKTGVAL